MECVLSYQEKTLYGSLAAELIVYIPYFFFPHDTSVEKVAGMIVAIIVLQIVLQSVIAALMRRGSGTSGALETVFQYEPKGRR